MNDFTKEELQHIALLFKFTEVAYPDYKLNEDLWFKVDTMIENHCEHKETEVIGGWVSRCVNCGMKFGDETQ